MIRMARARESAADIDVAGPETISFSDAKAKAKAEKKTDRLRLVA